MKWHDYSIENPPDDLDEDLFIARVESVSDGSVYQQVVMWIGTCFMELEDEVDGGWVGPVKTVTHWKPIHNK